jgi:hypothetical protein
VLRRMGLLRLVRRGVVLRLVESHGRLLTAQGVRPAPDWRAGSRVRAAGGIQWSAVPATATVVADGVGTGAAAMHRLPRCVPARLQGQPAGRARARGGTGAGGGGELRRQLRLPRDVDLPGRQVHRPERGPGRDRDQREILSSTSHRGDSRFPARLQSSNQRRRRREARRKGRARPDPVARAVFRPWKRVA